MSNRFDVLGILFTSFFVSSLAGLAALLRGGKKLSYRTVFSSVLNSGLAGLAFALLWYAKFEDNIYYLVGLCILAGFGGHTVIDFMVVAFQRAFTGNGKIEDGDEK